MADSKLVLVKDGKIAGWVIATIATFLFILAWIFAFIFDPVASRMDRLGDKLTFAYFAVFGTWVASKTAKKFAAGTAYNVRKIAMEAMDEKKEEIKGELAPRPEPMPSEPKNALS